MSTADGGTVKGPASYFPSIEKKYGRPVGEWLDLVRSSPLEKHMDVVAWLKTEHGLGHGHANALVAHVRASAARTEPAPALPQSRSTTGSVGQPAAAAASVGNGGGVPPNAGHSAWWSHQSHSRPRVGTEVTGR